MLFPLDVAKHKNVMLCNLRMTVLIWFRRRCGVFNPLSTLSQTNRWKIKQLRRNKHVPYLSCFLIFFPEVCLLEAVLPYPPDGGVDSQEMTEEKLKGSGRSMMYCRGRDRGQIHFSFLSLFLYWKILLQTDRYPVSLDFFLISRNYDLDFAEIVD